ncbi:MAG: MFS transporter, partial [Clostridiales bacterium]|nr:MFS transporter [Clostridiales bacterium]
MLKKSNKLFVALGYLISLVTGMQTAGYQYIIISMRDEFALSNAGMAVLGSVQSVVGLLMSFVFSRFIDKVDKRKLLFTGGGIYILGCLCNGFSSGAGMTIAALVIAGIGGNVLSTALYPALCSTDPQNSSKYTNMLQVFYGAGAMIAPMALSVFMGSGGMNWRGHYLIISASMLLMLALSALVRPETSMRLEREVQVAQQAERPNFAKIYRTAAFWLLSLSIGLYMCMETGLMNYARQYFEAIDDPKSAGLAISVSWGLMLPTRFIASKMKRHKGKMVCISFLFAGLAMLLMAVLRIPVVSLIWCAIFGLFAGPGWPTILSIGMDTFPRESGKAYSLICIGSGL